MDWNKFKNKFHKSWHTSIKKFIESNECNKIYNFLKNQKGKEIAPTSNLTFRAFEQPLKNVKVVVLLDEPYCEKYDGKQFADGIPLSCAYVEKLHPHLDTFYNAMEKEFYELNLNIHKETNLNFYIRQGVMFLSSSLTVEIDSPGSHKQLWVPFIKYLIKNIFNKKNIPIIFCGNDVYEPYKNIMEPISFYFIIEQSLRETSLAIPWNTRDRFTKLNNFLYENTDYPEIMWVNMDVPF
jgi:uracil-DNA glycosylase